MKSIPIFLALLFVTPFYCLGADVTVSVHGSSFAVGDIIRGTIVSHESKTEKFLVKFKRETFFVDETCQSFQLSIPPGSSRNFQFGPLTQEDIEDCGGSSNSYYVKVNIDWADNVHGYKTSNNFAVKLNEWRQSCSGCSPSCGVGRTEYCTVQCVDGLTGHVIGDTHCSSSTKPCSGTCSCNDNYCHWQPDGYIENPSYFKEQNIHGDRIGSKVCSKKCGKSGVKYTKYVCKRDGTLVAEQHCGRKPSSQSACNRQWCPGNTEGNDVSCDASCKVEDTDRDKKLQNVDTTGRAITTQVDSCHGYRGTTYSQPTASANIQAFYDVVKASYPDCNRMIITSGYRGPDCNTLVKGDSKSSHLGGYGTDFVFKNDHNGRTCDSNMVAQKIWGTGRCAFLMTYVNKAHLHCTSKPCSYKWSVEHVKCNVHAPGKEYKLLTCHCPELVGTSDAIKKHAICENVLGPPPPVQWEERRRRTLFSNGTTTSTNSWLTFKFRDPHPIPLVQKNRQDRRLKGGKRGKRGRAPPARDPPQPKLPPKQKAFSIPKVWARSSEKATALANEVSTRRLLASAPNDDEVKLVIERDCVEYGWKTGSWSSCSNKKRLRAVYCEEIGATVTRVDDAYCASVPKPAKEEKCGGTCFSPDSEVMLRNGSSVTIESMQTLSQPEIRTTDTHGNITFSKVYMTVCDPKTVTASFVKINTESGQSIEMTYFHFLHVADEVGDKCCNYNTLKAAGNVEPGDYVWVMVDDKKLKMDKVTSVTTIDKAGLCTFYILDSHDEEYHMTQSVIVNSVAASHFSGPNEALDKFGFEGFEKTMAPVKSLHVTVPTNNILGLEETHKDLVFVGEQLQNTAVTCALSSCSQASIQENTTKALDGIKNSTIDIIVRDINEVKSNLTAFEKIALVVGGNVPVDILTKNITHRHEVVVIVSLVIEHVASELRGQHSHYEFDILLTVGVTTLIVGLASILLYFRRRQDQEKMEQGGIQMTVVAENTKD